MGWSGLVGVRAADPGVAEVLNSSGVRGGLAVHVGASDGSLECGLTNEGRISVHGLALDDASRDAARKTIFSKGLYGLASVATWNDRTRLPYATNLANLLVADLDALGAAAPKREELERVMAPDGVMFLKLGGKWAKHVKPRPGGMDDWGHFDYDAQGLGTSQDELVEPVRQQQWIASLQPIPIEGNPAGYDPGAGVRIDGRFAVMDVNDSRGAPEKAKKSDYWVLHCRDAFNGTPLWTIPRDVKAARSRWSLVAEDGVAYAWLKIDEELTAIDLASGKVLRTFAGTEQPEKVDDRSAICLRVGKQALLVGLNERLDAFDLKTGERAWSFAEEGMRVLVPVLDEARGRVYCVVAEAAERDFRSRWPTSQVVRAVVALDLKTGKTVWECEAAASVEIPHEKSDKEPRFRGIGQLVPGDKHLVVFGSKAIGGGKSPFIGAIDLETGELVHADDHPFEPNYNAHSYNVLWRDGLAYFAGAFTRVWSYDPATGDIVAVVNDSWNQRCTRFAATPKWLMFGQAAYYDENGAGVQASVGRAGCALPNTPANGMTYFTPTMCGCTTLVRGFQAMSGEKSGGPAGDALRLVKGGPPVAIQAAAGFPEGPVAEDWIKQDRAGQSETAPVKAGELELVAYPHQHRLEARRGSQVAWNFVADARISSPPVFVDGVAVFGAHDGWVYAVGGDGSLKWKSLLAPAERAIGINGQLENSWPVYGVALLDGKVVASAGTHVEFDGGVTVAAFEPKTGERIWTKELQKSSSPVPAGGKRAEIAAYSFLNSVPKVADGMIELGDGGRRGGTFRFSPDEDEATLNSRLNSPEKKGDR